MQDLSKNVLVQCNNLNCLDYSCLQNYDEFWCCRECCSTIFPFNSLLSNKNFLACCTITDSTITQWKDLENDHNSSFSFKTSSNLELLLNQYNNATPENSTDPAKISSVRYHDIGEMQNIQISHKNKSLSQFHINACSLNKNFDDL